MMMMTKEVALLGIVRDTCVCVRIQYIIIIIYIMFTNISDLPRSSFRHS